MTIQPTLSTFVTLTVLLTPLLPVAPEARAQDAAPPDAPSDDADDDAYEVVVEQDATASDPRASTEAVTRVDTTTAQRETIDLGEQLARTAGISIQRTGGLGASQRLALDGLGDDQVRVFFDGVPLASTGLGTTVADVPPELVRHVDVFHGVVPIRYGADALGGALDLVPPDPEPGAHGHVSWQSGSWDTHRLTGQVRWLDHGVGVVAGGFFDSARNDWRIDVDVADRTGALSPVTLTRQHAAYRAGGGRVGLVVRDKPWADRFDLTALASDTHKEIPHNQVMTVPYGGVATARTATGVTARWRKLVGAFDTELLAAWSWRRTRLLDEATVVYDWFGQEVRERPTAGELDGKPHDRLTWQQALYARGLVRWLPHPRHRVELVVTPDVTWRTGDERDQAPDDPRDAYEADQRQTKVTTSLGWTGEVVRDRLEVSAAVTSYVYRARMSGLTAAYAWETLTRAEAPFGATAALRATLVPHLFLKASYQRAVRLPGPDEVFGDGILVSPNLELEPERSHNANLSLQLVGQDSPAGRFDATVRGAARFADQLVVLMSRDVTLQWQNVFRARALAVHGALAWSAPGDWVSLSGSTSWLDLRNTSDEGPLVTYAGDRVPNRPWLHATGRLAVQVPHVGVAASTLGLHWTTRYVHAFFRGWPSAGLAETKQVIPAQVVHDVGVTWSLQTARDLHLVATLDLHNLLDGKTFDVFGVQRPGRSVAGKLSLSW
ncbi:MAG: TonB-dependent receptor [Alphaproteobacteria bacterium]|nr:TonB-dependent receptor [Alphaproteobacteria bacterium]